MRRPVPIALLVSALAFVPGALGQQGAGMGRPGSYGGHVPAPAGHMGGIYGRGYAGVGGGFPGQYTGVPRMVSPAPQAITPTYRIPTLTNGGSFVTLGRGWRGDGDHHGDRRGDHRGDRDRSPYGGGYGYGYPVYPGYVNSWSVLPWDFGTPDSSAYDDSSAGQAAPAQQAESAPAQYPSDAGSRPAYSEALPEPPPPARSVQQQPVAPEPELTLIFRDGHHESIHNYVLTPSTIVVLDQAASGRQMRIPLDQIDVPATQRAARDAGLDFTPPA